MATSLEQIVTCSVCLRRYNDPRILPCQHSFCLRPCLETIFNPNTRRIRCPLCREDHLILKSLAGSLPVNRTILNLLDIPLTTGTEDNSLSGAAAAGPSPATASNDNVSLASGAASMPISDSSSPSCPLCRNTIHDSVRCQHCNTDICQTCFSIHTRQMRSDANRNLNQIRRQLPLVAECITVITDRSNNLSSNQNMVLADIDAAFEELAQIVQKRRRQLREEAEEAFVIEQRRLNSQKETLEVDCAALSSICQMMGDKLAERDVDISELIELRTTGEDYLKQINDEINQNRNLIMNETLKRSQFHHDMSQVRPSLSAFGSVLWNERSQTDSYPSMNSSGLPHERLFYGSNRTPRPAPGGASLFSRTNHQCGLRSTPAGMRSSGDNHSHQSTFQRLNFQDSRYVSFPSSHGRSNVQLNSCRSSEDNNFSGSLFMSSENPSFRTPRLSRQTVSNSVNQSRVNTELSTNQNHLSGRMSGNDNANVSTGRHVISHNQDSSQTSAQESDGQHNQEREHPNGSTEQISDSASGNEIIDLENSQPRCRERTFVLDRLPRPIAFEISGDLPSSTSASEPNAANRYSEKGVPLFVFGDRGSNTGQFCWPRGVAVARESSGAKIIVADSSNHRIQVFSDSGEYVSSHGSYGSGDGEFECLSGLAVDGMGQMIVSDRYNHRLIVLNRQGRYMLQVGEPGSREGQLSYPWGVATDQLGFIYVCDKDNHRVQVFTQNGIYVRQFGGVGKNPGEFENPHYLAVALDGRIYVSDTSNNRVQVFDPRGNFLFKFGLEGTGPGQLKYPRGIAIDDDGNVVLADSGNNRIQIFTSSGQFVYSFGAHGSGLGQFKGLEGVALFSDGKIVVSDRDNHRIQVF